MRVYQFKLPVGGGFITLDAGVRASSPEEALEILKDRVPGDINLTPDDPAFGYAQLLIKADAITVDCIDHEASYDVD